MLSVTELFDQAVRAAESGRLAEAISLFRQVLEADAAHAAAHFYLGNALYEQGHLAEAAESFRSGQRSKRHLADAYTMQGVALATQGQWDAAVASFRQALAANPNHVAARFNLGNALANQGQAAEAALCYRQVLRIDPNMAEAHNNLGNALKNQGHIAQAADCFRHALRINPNYVEAHNNLGVALKDQGKMAEAAQCYRHALKLDPRHADVHYNLGNVLKDDGRLDEAMQCYRQTLRLNPAHAEAITNMGNILKDQGNLAEALGCYRQALAVNPAYSTALSSLIFALHYSPDQDAATIFAECRRWNEVYAEPLAKLILPHANDKTSERRLRIGYVSPDFSGHPVGRYLLPLLEGHDHARFEIYGYSSVNLPDEVTDRCRALADVWRPVFGAGDEQVAQLVRQDRIDILVDLTLHTMNHRLLLFARKPAPVQVTFAGYPGGTGLSAIDYRLTDPYLDPPGLFDHWFAETSYRLPHSFWCYPAPSDELTPVPLPALTNGFITFGCLNNFCKVNDGVLELWAQVLRAVPGSRLLLLAPEGDHRQRTLDCLGRQGIAAERVTFVPRLGLTAYLELFHQLDIMLDTFPYNGHTSSLDAYWMGVPVVTLVGRTVVGRAGLSQLTNLGLESLAATTPADFIRRAVDLAGNLTMLATLRLGLRARMRQSPLMDAAGFARGIEEAYRAMWRKWIRSVVC